LNSESFRVIQIDHVELFVPDRQAAAMWYESVLGLVTVPEVAQWAVDPEGPLMISPDHGKTMLALFQGTPQGERPTAGFHRVAFSVDGKGFLTFLERIKEMKIGPSRIRDHDQAISIYFDDPYGHHLEVTTYEPAGVRPFLPSLE
jgi:catechol 2,3-dioxygenase-like lactoylglutathione lyase family enzyme